MKLARVLLVALCVLAVLGMGSRAVAGSRSVVLTPVPALPAIDEGTQLTDAVVATMTDTAGLGAPLDYAVNINWGDGIKSGGKLVASSFTNEIQTVTVTGDETGHFNLTFNGQTTGYLSVIA